MMCHLLLWIAFSFSLTGVADGQRHDQYTVFELLEMSRENCTTDVCEVRGSVETMNSQGSGSAVKVAVYGVQGQNGAMQLLGISHVTSSPTFDSWKVSFNLQDAQSLILLYIPASNGSVPLVRREGKNMRMFLLEAPDQCHLDKSNAVSIVDWEFRIMNLSTVTPACDTVFTSRCTGEFPGPGPISTTAGPASPTSTTPPVNMVNFTTSRSDCPTAAATDSSGVRVNSPNSITTLLMVNTLAAVVIIAVIGHRQLF